MPSSPSSLNSPLTFPISRRQISNRLAKAALTEGLADPNICQPNERHFTLYSQWVGGCGMILSGNVMIDRRHREGTRNVVLDETSDLNAFRQWADVIRNNNSNSNTISNNDDDNNKPPLAILQISHPGRQSPISCTNPLNITPVAPTSALQTRLALPGILGAICAYLFIAPARALSTEELPAIVNQYATAARLAQQSGWDGIEIHAAHGYLLSQFLSPASNQRMDEYGGTRDNRRRLLRQVVMAVREATSPDFVVGVKINTKDRSTEGIEREDECLELIRNLSDMRQLDFIELSGGSFEEFVFVFEQPRGRDGIFSTFAKRLRKEVFDNKEHNDSSDDNENDNNNIEPKIILTGGFRTKAGMEGALRSGACDVIGLGRPMIANPNFARELLSRNDGKGGELQSTSTPLTVPIFKKMLEMALNSLWYQRQLHRLAVGKAPDPGLSYIYTLIVTFFSVYIWDVRFTGELLPLPTTNCGDRACSKKEE